MTGPIEIAKPTSADLARILTFEDALAFANTFYDEVLDVATDIGDGFSVIKEEGKAGLVGKPFLLIGWRISHDEVTDRDYSVVTLVTSDNRKLVLTDGSTGIHSQLTATFATRAFAPVVVRKGLSRSDYVVQVNGKKQDATTYYLDTNVE